MEDMPARRMFCPKQNGQEKLLWKSFSGKGKGRVLAASVEDDTAAAEHRFYAGAVGGIHDIGEKAVAGVHPRAGEVEQHGVGEPALLYLSGVYAEGLSTVERRPAEHLLCRGERGIALYLGEQGGELSFYKKSASQIADSLRALKTEINRLASQIEEASAEYQAAKKQTIAMQKQYKEYKEKDAAVKQAHAEEIGKIEKELAQLAKAVPAATLEKYKAKLKEKLFPVVCEVAHNRCPQCGMELSLAEMSKLDSGTLIECDSCHRTLFKRK